MTDIVTIGVPSRFLYFFMAGEIPRDVVLTLCNGDTICGEFLELKGTYMAVTKARDDIEKWLAENRMLSIPKDYDISKQCLEIAASFQVQGGMRRFDKYTEYPYDAIVFTGPQRHQAAERIAQKLSNIMAVTVELVVSKGDFRKIENCKVEFASFWQEYQVLVRLTKRWCDFTLCLHGKAERVHHAYHTIKFLLNLLDKPHDHTFICCAGMVYR